MAKWENIVTDWKIEYKPVWNVEGNIAGWKPKASVYACGGMAEVVFADEGKNQQKSVVYMIYIQIIIQIFQTLFQKIAHVINNL